MVQPGVSDTVAYYSRDGAPSLFWEMTVCASLADRESPCFAALSKPRPYGEILARFLTSRTGLDSAWSVVEVGGGYGTLMASFLEVLPAARVTLVDISPFFLAKQRESLAKFPCCRFVNADAFEYLRNLEDEVDLVVSNENIGDFPTVTGIGRGDLARALEGKGGDQLTLMVAEKFRRYGLDLSEAPELFHFNLGAVEYLERLYPKARVVFLCEHGADTVVPPPYDDFLSPPPGDGYPRRIPLRGHDEYTVKFDHLEAVARSLGYGVERFHMAEFLGLRHDASIRCMARVRTTASEVAEAVHEFCDHVAEYQGMLLTR